MLRPLPWLRDRLAAVGLVRRRPEEPGATPDPRADELRTKLDESRALVEERDEFEGAELTVDQAEPAPEDPETRRRAVHEEARSTVDRMRESSS